MTTKEYNTPMLQVVSIKNSDIVTASETISVGANYNGSDAVLDAGRRFDDWDAGY